MAVYIKKFMKTISALFTNYKYLIVVILFSVLGSLDLLHYGIPPTHDGEYHIMRFWQFYETLSSGVLYPRWAPDFNNGFGIPIFSYVYPLPNYAASLFHFMGFSYIESLKLNMAVASIVGAFFFYLWSRRYWGELGGVVSSVFYTFAPYHFLDIYVRGSVGEVWSLAIAPGLLWAYLAFTQNNKKLYFSLSCLLLGLLVFAHNILALVFFSFFILYSVFIILESKDKKYLIVNTLLICILGLGLSAPFWLPAIIETKYVQGLQIFNPTAYFPKLYQLIYSSWGYGFAGVDPKPGEGQMSFQIGIPNLIVTSIVFLFLVFSKKLKYKKIIIFSVALLLFFVFLITPFSEIFWKIVPGVSFIQFPWRLLSVVILICAFLAGSIIEDSLFKGKKKLQLVVSLIMILIVVIYGIRYAREPFYHKRPDNHYLSRSNFTDGTNSPGDVFNTKWLKSIPPKARQKIEIIKGQGKIENVYQYPQQVKFSAIIEKKSKILVNIAYFPGWTATSNNKNIRVENYNGKISLRLNNGKQNINLYLANTLIQNWSYVYFLIAILAIIYYKPYEDRS